MPVVAVIWSVAFGVAVGVALFDAWIIWMYSSEGKAAARICKTVLAQWLALGVMAGILSGILASPAS